MWCLGRASSGAQMVPPCYVFTRWKNQGALWGLFYKDTNPTDEGFALITESAPNTIMLEVRISAYEFRGRHKNPDIGTKNHFLWQTVNLPKPTAQHTSFVMNTSWMDSTQPSVIRCYCYNRQEQREKEREECDRTENIPLLQRPTTQPVMWW